MPTAGFGGAFAFAEPAVLTQNWTQANVFLATVVGLLLLAAWVGVVLAADRWGGRWGQRGRAVVLGGLGVVSLVAVIQMTSNIAQANLPAAKANTTGLVTASGLKPGQVLAVDEGIHAKGVSWESWMPQAFEVWWTQLEFFNPAKGPPPANATVVETEWLPGSRRRPAGLRHRRAGGSWRPTRPQAGSPGAALPLARGGAAGRREAGRGGGQKLAGGRDGPEGL